MKWRKIESAMDSVGEVFAVLCVCALLGTCGYAGFETVSEVGIEETLKSIGLWMLITAAVCAPFAAIGVLRDYVKRKSREEFGREWLGEP